MSIKNYPLYLLISTLSLSILYSHKKAIVKNEFILKNPPFQSCHASTICETNEGTILCSFFAGTKEGANDVGIWMVELKNNVWEKPKEIFNDKKTPSWNPVLFKMPSKEIFLFYKLGKNPERWSGFLQKSFDNGKTWEKSKIFPAGVFGPIKNKPLILDDGTMLCGSSTESYKAWTCWVDITKDKGKTWEKSTPIVDSNNSFGIIQPTIFLTNNNNIKMLTRSKKQKIFSSISFDKGKTWSKAKPTNLPNPNSGIDAVKLKDGRLFLVYNHSKKNRYPLNVAISEDDGNSWKKSITLENEEGSFSYPAIIQTKDGYIHITYTWNRKNIKYVVINPKYL